MPYVTVYRSFFQDGFSQPTLYLKLFIEQPVELGIGRNEDNIIRSVQELRCVSRKHGSITAERGVSGTINMIYRDKNSTFGTYYVPQRNMNKAEHIKDKQIPLHSGDMLLIKDNDGGTGVAYMVVIEEK